MYHYKQAGKERDNKTGYCRYCGRPLKECGSLNQECGPICLRKYHRSKVRMLNLDRKEVHDGLERGEDVSDK